MTHVTQCKTNSNLRVPSEKKQLWKKQQSKTTEKTTLSKCVLGSTDRSLKPDGETVERDELS